jgi:hypothetical protein
MGVFDELKDKAESLVAGAKESGGRARAEFADTPSGRHDLGPHSSHWRGGGSR